MRRSSCSATDVAAVSSFRETDPVGYLDQPRFLNGAARLETELEPRALLDRLLDVERELGRRRDGPRFGPRTVDLDLLALRRSRDRRAGPRSSRTRACTSGASCWSRSPSSTRTSSYPAGAG